MQALLRRIFQENRRLLVPVVGALALNVLLYVGVVYPLSARARSTERRASTAVTELRAAVRDREAVNRFEGTVFDVEDVGSKRPGTRYRVQLVVKGEVVNALVYMRGKQTEDDFDIFLWCYYHDSMFCQCVEAVKDLRQSVRIDPPETRDGA